MTKIRIKNKADYWVSKGKGEDEGCYSDVKGGFSHEEEWKRRKGGVVLGHSQQDMGVMFALLQSVHTLGLPLRPGLQKHCLSPQDT